MKAIPSDIISYNDKGVKHGPYVEYHNTGKLFRKGEYVNGQRHGYWENYYPSGSLCYKGTYDMGKVVGYWIDGAKLFYAN